MQAWDQNAPFDAILFDKDGTLIDFDATWGPAAFAVMANLADGDGAALEELMRVSEYVLAERRFLPSSPLVAGSSAHYGPLWAQALGRGCDADFLALMDRLFLEAGLVHLAPIGDPQALCRDLERRGYLLGIATNDSQASAQAQARALGIDAQMRFVAGYDSGHGSKPEPGMITAFVAAHAMAPARVALVGDSLHDLHAARAAGICAIAVLSGPRGEAARVEVAPFADYVIPSIVGLPALLDGLAPSGLRD
ncbi:MAG: HAD family hydrolase [Salinarimonas sp.]|nr:HAD family hydrolase [Salinarimonas sp.]